MRSKEVDEAIKLTYENLNQDKNELIRVIEYKRGDTMKEYLEKEIKRSETLLAYISELEKEILVLENTKNTCPALSTSGVLCPLKAMITGEPIENALVMPNAENVSKEIEKDIRRKIENANRFNPFNGRFES